VFSSVHPGQTSRASDPLLAERELLGTLSHAPLMGTKNGILRDSNRTDDSGRHGRQLNFLYL
jgi:hypothetical protein